MNGNVPQKFEIRKDGAIPRKLDCHFALQHFRKKNISQSKFKTLLLFFPIPTL